MDFLLTTLLGGVILYCVYYLLNRNLKYWEKRGIPHLNEGISTYFYNVVDLVFPQKDFDGIILEAYRKTEGYKFCGMNIFLKPNILLRDPEVVYNVLIKDFSYFSDRPFPVDEEREPLSGHLFSLRGDRWRGLRYKLAPTFTSGKLKSMFPQITACADDILTYIKEKKHGTFEVKELTSCFTLNVIGSVAFGMKVDAHKYLDGEKSQFVELSQKFFKPSIRQFLMFIIASLFPKFSKAFGISMVDKDVNNFFLNVVKDTIKHRKDTGTKRNDFLQLMINIMEKEANNEKQTLDKNDLHEEHHDDNDKELLENVANMKNNSSQFKLTENTLAANSFIFISGGSETVASALTFAMFELAENPHVQSRLQNEIDLVLSEQKLDYSAISSMVYLDRVVNETHRKHPPISNLSRMCVADYKIPGTEYVIKKGEELTVPVVGLHRDPELFPHPETFDPDRFLEPDTIKKGSYLPFGTGPRFCIAQRLALLEVKVLLARTLMEYNLKLSPKTKVPLVLLKNMFSKSVEGGVWIEFEPRS